MSKYLIFFLVIGVYTTIDLNESELIYLANHLSIEECRKLVAYAHYKSFDLPNELDQAEHKLSLGTSCIDLLNHWNSAKGEGKGETHEVLEHRLRQMNKKDLADWLGKTVFRQLGPDMERELKYGFKELLNDTTTIRYAKGPTFMPVIDDTPPTTWLPIDSILYAIIVILLVIFIIVCFQACYVVWYKCLERRRKGKNRMYRRVSNDVSESEDEEDDKFDIRNHEKSKKIKENSV
ncbi:unnamed protein product [Brassicogethes aeneus]|uniref:Death domain-containing protein n=1 Tax=Brassicogethes aeneus TaxID=1431903 RepID=A0A9P0BI87_BRAAE|nr:unnamed protein product [Brassicogethes aeneus]